MGKSIGYWLLARQSWNVFKPTEYFQHVGYATGMVTRDKKKAARWFTLEEARTFGDSHICAYRWRPVLVLFDGDEPAIL